MTRQIPSIESGEGYGLLSRVDAVVQTLFQHIDALEASLSDRVRLLGR
jgi:hypothetical protein